MKLNFTKMQGAGNDYISVSYTHLDVYKRQIERYWDVDFRHPTALSYEAAADEIDARVRESVAAHRCV